MTTTTKHRAIHAELLGRILSGAWPPGAAIPHEAELAREFAVTRPTIARALADLVGDGLIERRRRAGSRVAERRPAEAVLRIPLIREEIEAEGRAYGYRLLSRERVETPPAAIGAVVGPDPALRLLCLHSADGAPYQFEDRWINLATAPAAETADFERVSPNEWLVEAMPFSRAEQALTAEAASPAEADRLAIGEGAPVFVITRSTWLDEAPVTRARLVHPGARFRLIARDRGPAA
ncbi:GntR family transcriptional regulator [Amaricoccus solimangrovi]|uniref:UTRA domain-containing protein n=1 Tax=Amaricoccus solimangrovi TaxID=2589815 RepID=A0A501X124_9RHOB|nr:GntR family transcriptional regulator [Amaricoccus solimangrovi]TPE53036.1 UTRA domain-containing protein [Amaricoccus solimangrovi]